jgi:hypothetical protein
VLRLDDGHYALHRSAGADVPLGLGQWHEADGWKLRITHALAPDAQMTVMDNPSWAAPEIRITSAGADGLEKQTRCVLPVEEGSELVVGRSAQHANLAIEDDHVSRRHVRFFTQEGRRYVEDLGSRWGTRINGKALTDAVELKHGDEIIAGNSTIQYICYWDILPEAGASQALGVGGDLSVRASELAPPGASLESQRPGAGSVGQSYAGPAEAEPPSQENAPPPDAPEPMVQHIPPDEEGLAKWDDGSTPAKKPGKRTWAQYMGFDVIGAILLVLALLAGMAYLAWKVFQESGVSQ